jgi:hypothetical protein
MIGLTGRFSITIGTNKDFAATIQAVLLLQGGLTRLSEAVPRLPGIRLPPAKDEYLANTNRVSTYPSELYNTHLSSGPSLSINTLHNTTYKYPRSSNLYHDADRHGRPSPGSGRYTQSLAVA